VTLRRVAIGCGIAVVVLVLLAGCGIAAAISELPSGEHPDVDFRNREIGAARDAIVPELEDQLDQMERRFGAERVGDRIRIDRCERGFDDFTRTDQFAYACRMTLVELVPVREPFKEEASRLGEALLSGDCPDGTDTDRALAEPFTRVTQLDGSTGDCTPGLRIQGPEIRGWLSVPADADEIELEESILRPSCFREFCEIGRLDLGASAAAAPHGTAALAVAQAEETYYLVAWKCPWPASWLREVCNNDDYSPVR
jgi:hypothetical protein